MEEEIIDEVTDWDTAPVGRGYAGLRELADRDFSGAVTDDLAWAFLLNGRVVGVFDGSMDSFEDAELTAYVAPAPAVPLLFSMQATGGETRASYYTNETPLSEVDETLSEGNFTGFVELSENVLSGDYYVVYYGGRSMSAAWVGSSRRLVTGDEAFELADDEVGIYEVRSVDVEVTDVPEPSDADAAPASSADVDAAGAGAGTDADNQPDAATDPGVDAGPSVGAGQSGDADQDAEATGAAPGDDVDAPSTSGDAAAAEPTAADEPGPGAEAEAATEDGDAAPSADAPAAGEDPDAPERDAGSDAGTDSGTVKPATEERPDEPDGVAREDAVADVAPDARGADAEDAASSPDGADGDTTGVTFGGEDGADAGASHGSGSTRGSERGADAAGTREAPSRDAVSDAPSARGPQPAPGDDADADAFSEEERWREAKAIPSLDPDDTSAEVTASSGGPGSTAAGVGTTSRPSRRDAATSDDTGASERARGRSARTQDSSRTKGDTARDAPSRGGDDRAGAGGRGGLRDRLRAEAQRREELEAELDAIETERDELTAERDDLQARLESLSEDHDELATERDRLQDRVEELESTVEELERELAGEQLGLGDEPEPERTMDRTGALEGTNLFVRYADKSAPTLSDIGDGSADPGTVEENLRLEYHTAFDTEDLAVDGEPFEAFLHDTMEYSFVDWLVRVLPYELQETGNANALDGLYEAIPRVDRIELQGTVSVETDDGVVDHEFDVVLWDSMGDPLVVANLNDSRDPATAGMVQSVVEGGRDIAAADESLGAAFVVTSSYFEPESLEASADATGGGLLSRSKRKSFVKLSRKQGFHLVLVEARNGEFYVNFPDL